MFYIIKTLARPLTVNSCYRFNECKHHNAVIAAVDDYELYTLLLAVKI